MKTFKEFINYGRIEEKAVSKAQQRFFGMVRATQKGEMENPSPEVSKAASSIRKSEVKDFAKTKHKGLPNKKDVKEQMKVSPEDKKEKTKVSPENRKLINKEIMMQKKQHILDRMRMQMKKRGELPITSAR